MDENIYNLFYKIIENPRCIKYYNDLLDYYTQKKEQNKCQIYKKIIEKIKNDSNLSSDEKQ